MLHWWRISAQWVEWVKLGMRLRYYLAGPVAALSSELREDECGGRVNFLSLLAHSRAH